MATKTGTGFSVNKNTDSAVSEAWKLASKKLDGKQAGFIFTFVSTSHDYKKVLEKIKGLSGTSNIVGCSTAGEFTESNASTGGLSIMAISSDSIRFSMEKVTDVKHENFKSIADSVFGNYKDEARKMLADGFQNQTIFVLTDGFMTNRDELIKDIYAKTGISSQLVGGSAGDDVKFTRTDVFFGTESLTNALVFVKAFSKNKIGVGVSHGMQPSSNAMRVTKSDGSKVYELDGKLALDVYKEHAKSKGIELTPENTSLYLINNELGIKDLTFQKIRAPISANPDGSLNMAGEVPQGAMVTIVESGVHPLLKAASDAAKEAKDNLKGSKAAGVIVFDCICRQIILGDDYIKEAQTISEILDNTPTIGFSTYGEIAKTAGKLNGFHNGTVVVCALPE